MNENFMPFNIDTQIPIAVVKESGPAIPPMRRLVPVVAAVSISTIMAVTSIVPIRTLGTAQDCSGTRQQNFGIKRLRKEIIRAGCQALEHFPLLIEGG